MVPSALPLQCKQEVYPLQVYKLGGTDAPHLCHYKFIT